MPLLRKHVLPSQCGLPLQLLPDLHCGYRQDHAVSSCSRSHIIATRPHVQLSPFHYHLFEYSMPTITKAVVFDLGGVVVKSPFIAISEYETKLGLPTNYINVALTRRGDCGVFQRFERGELTYREFIRVARQELNDVVDINSAYTTYWTHRYNKCGPVPLLPQQICIDPVELFGHMLDVASVPNNVVIEYVRELKHLGYKVAALTNNFRLDSAASCHVQPINLKLNEIFDVVVESCVVGLRKPDPKIYQVVCERLAVQPNEVVFLDDITATAKSLGMSTVKVHLGKEKDAVDKLRFVVSKDCLPSKI